MSAQLRSWLHQRGWTRVARPCSRTLLTLEWLETRTLLAGHTLAAATLPDFHAVHGTDQAAEVSGFVTYPKLADLYRVNLDAGEQLTAALHTQSQGSGLQALLRIFAASGLQVAADYQEGGDPQLAFQAATAGDYFIGISSAANANYNPFHAGTGDLHLEPGQGTDAFEGAYTLDLRLAALASRPDLAASSFRLGADTAVLGDTIPVTFAVENRGGAESTPFTIQVLQSADNLFGLPQVLQSVPVPDGLLPGQAFSATVSVHLTPASGPAYLGLGILSKGTPAFFDPLSLQRGSSWELLPLLTPVVSGGNNRISSDLPVLSADDRNQAQALPDLNSRVSGSVPADQAELYQIQVIAPGQLDVQLQPDAGSSLRPRLTLYDDAGSLFISADAGAEQAAARLTQHLPPGTYYLSVSAQTAGGSYALTTEFTRGSPPLQQLPVRPSPRQVVAADVNRDGRPDLVVAHGSDHTVSVLLNQGDGIFGTPKVFEGGKNLSALAVADVDGDGNPDIIVTDLDAATVGVLLGQGDGTFAAPLSFPVGVSPISVVVGDVNGDSKPDLVVANGVFDNTVSVLLGQGDGTFRPQETFRVGPFPVAVAVGDLDNDGHLDLVVANLRAGTVTVMLGQGDGNFTFPDAFPVGAGAAALAVADVNGDGKPDLVVVNSYDNTLSVLLGKGDGTFAPQSVLQAGTIPLAVAVADVNGDGHPDLVTANQADDTASVLLGQGDGTFTVARSVQAGQYPLSVAVADINGDGKPDVVVGNQGTYLNPKSTVSVLLGQGDGTFGPPPAFATGFGPNSVAVADVNGDGHPDLVTANAGTTKPAHTVSVLLGQGDGTFAPEQAFLTGPGPYSVAVADVNGDGNPDLVVPNPGGLTEANNTLSVLLGKGDGTFALQKTFVVGARPTSVVVADVNGDGSLDLIVSNYNDATLGVLLGKGNGSFDSEQVVARRDFASRSVRVADINGDGIPDLITTDSPNDTVSVLLGKGNSTFAPPHSFAVGSIPTAATIADVDADGKLDLVASNSRSDTVSVLLGKGNGTFAPQRTFAAGDFPTDVMVADINGDGKSDLVVTSAYDRAVDVLLGHGDGTFALPQVFPVGTGPSSVAVADVNEDGVPDVVSANLLANTASVLLGEGDGTFRTATPLSGVGVRSTPLLADLDGDHIADSVVLDRRGRILFRRGLPGAAGSFAPPVPLNPDLGADGRQPLHPARDLALVQTSSGVVVAAADVGSNTVSLYRVAPDGDIHRSLGFATDLLPQRIAAADLDGDGRDDLVLADALDHQVAIALQNSSGGFNLLTIQDVGVAPSDILLVDVNADGLLDVVLSDEASGDVAVFLDDGTHTFSTTYRFRAGVGPYELAASAIGPVLDSRAQPVALAAGAFTGPGHTDLVVVNRGEHSLSVLPGDGDGGFANPQATLTTSTSEGLTINDQPGPLVAGDFNDDGRSDVAVLMEDRNEVWVYSNRGFDSTGRLVLAHTQSIEVSTLSTGLALAPGTGSGPFDLLVGNQYGDVLTLVGNADGSFKPLFLGTDVPFLATDLNGDKVPDVILANQSADQVLAQIRQAGTNTFTVGDFSQGAAEGLKLPGALALEILDTDKLLDLVVADSGSNRVLVYLGIGPGHFSTTPQSSFVGDSPTGVTIADLNGDKLLDLAVANEGSNDVSVLMGSHDSTGKWMLTTGSRLDAGTGPVSVAVLDVTGVTARGNVTGQGDGIPDLMITSSQDGTVSVLPGIGSSSQGTGFFKSNLDTLPTLQLPGPVVQTIIQADPAAPALALTQDGSIFRFNPDNLAQAPVQVFDSTPERAVMTLAATMVNGVVEVVAGRGDNSLSLLTPNTQGQLTESLVFHDERLDSPSALQVVEVNGTPEIYVTDAGQSVPVVIGFSAGTLPPLPPPTDSPEPGNPSVPPPGPNPSAANQQGEETGEQPAATAGLVDLDTGPLPSFEGSADSGGERGQSVVLESVNDNPATVGSVAVLETGNEDSLGGETSVVSTGPQSRQLPSTDNAAEASLESALASATESSSAEPGSDQGSSSTPGSLNAIAVLAQVATLAVGGDDGEPTLDNAVPDEVLAADLHLKRYLMGLPEPDNSGAEGKQTQEQAGFDQDSALTLARLLEPGELASLAGRQLTRAPAAAYAVLAGVVRQLDRVADVVSQTLAEPGPSAPDRRGDLLPEPTAPEEDFRLPPKSPEPTPGPEEDTPPGTNTAVPQEAVLDALFAARSGDLAALAAPLAVALLASGLLPAWPDADPDQRRLGGWRQLP